MENKYDIFNMKSEEVKFNAFFQYLKSFSQAGLFTLQKLETSFNKQMRKKLKHSETLPTIKNLLASYEIFILQVKDSCDFVEIPQFGDCIGKTFVQLIKIIKWFLKSWLKSVNKNGKLKIHFQDSKQTQENESHQNVCSFCDEIIKTSTFTKQTRGKRKGGYENSSYEFREAKKRNEAEKTQVMEFQDRVFERYTQKEIESKRYIGENVDFDILNRKHMALKYQISNNENVLEQVLSELSMKTEAMARFVTNSQANFIENSNSNHQFQFPRFEQQMKEFIAVRYNEAKEKIKMLITQKVSDMDKQRRQQLVHRQMQTMPQEPERDKNQIKIKQLNSNMQKLKNELECQKLLNQNLRKLLESKSIQFQKQFLNFRKDMITTGEYKSKNILRTIKSFVDDMPQESIDKQLSIIKNVEKDDDEFLTSNMKQNLNKKVTSTGGLLRKDKNKDKQNIKKNNRNSIKFFGEIEPKAYNIVIGQQNKQKANIYTVQSMIQTEKIGIQASVQTQHINLGSIVSATDKLQLLQRQSVCQPRSIQKDKLKTNISQRKTFKKNQPPVYSHIKSKVYQPQKQKIKNCHHESNQIKSSNIGNLVKKLSMKKQIKLTEQCVPCFQLAKEPVFIQINFIIITISDVYNVFLNDKNAQAYQCLMHRNFMLSTNQKRIMTQTIKIQSSEVDWNFKRQMSANNSVQNSIFNAFNHQLSILKKKERAVYEQIKQLMRFPFEKIKYLDIVHLESSGQQPSIKDIEMGELKRMIGFIYKFHFDCLADHPDSICQHLLNFTTKIGIKLC